MDEKIMDTFVMCLFLCVCGRQKLKDPHFFHMADGAIIQGSIYEAWDLPCISVLSTLYYIVGSDVNAMMVTDGGCYMHMCQ